jgi:hypothetical protein
MIGDWRDPKCYPGLVSGNPFTDILGSAGMIFVYCLIQLEHTAPDLAEFLSKSNDDVLDNWVESYLTGKEKFSAPSKSDDAFLLFRGDPRIVENSRKLMLKMKKEEQVSPYMQVTLEHGGAMLGDIHLYDSTKDMEKARFIGNGNSMPSKIWVPEYACKLSPDIKGMYEPNRLKMRNRAYPGVAVDSRVEKYGSMPAYQTIVDVQEFAFNKFLADDVGMRYYTYFNKMRDDHVKWMNNDLNERMKIMIDRGLITAGSTKDQTLVEKEYLNEPDLLSWKFKDSDIREELIQMNFGSLAEDLTSNYLDTIRPTRNNI